MAEKDLRKTWSEIFEEATRSFSEAVKEDDKARDARLNAEHRQEQINRLHEENEGLRTDTELRKKMADRAYYLLVGWMFFLAVLVVLRVFEHLSDGVVISIVGATAVPVIGLMLAVIRGLFRVPPSPS